MYTNKPNFWGYLPRPNSGFTIHPQNSSSPNFRFVEEEELESGINDGPYDYEGNTKHRCPYYKPCPPKPECPPYQPKPECPPYPPKPDCPPYSPKPPMPIYGPCASSREQMLYIYQQLAASYAGLTATIITYDGSTLTGVISGAFNPTGFPSYIVLTIGAINYNVLIDRIAYIDIANTTLQPLKIDSCIKQSAIEKQLQEALIGTLAIAFIGSPLTVVENATVVYNYPGITILTYTELGINHVVYASVCSVIAYA